jgi:hypothetical protein
VPAAIAVCCRLDAAAVVAAVADAAPEVGMHALCCYCCCFYTLVQRCCTVPAARHVASSRTPSVSPLNAIPQTVRALLECDLAHSLNSKACSCVAYGEALARQAVGALSNHR